MKKIYMLPVVIFEDITGDEILAGSGGGTYGDSTTQYGGGNNNGGGEDPTDTDDGNDGTDAKMGDFAFAEDFEYSIDM